MAFLPIQYDDGQLVKMQVGATTFTKGDGCVFSSGYLTKAAGAQGGPVEYVIMETVASAATQGDLKLCIRAEGVRFLCDTDGTPAQSQVGTYADLASASTIDEDASADDLFLIEQIVSAGDKKVAGYFKHYTIES